MTTYDFNKVVTKTLNSKKLKSKIQDSIVDYVTEHTWLRIHNDLRFENGFYDPIKDCIKNILTEQLTTIVSEKAKEIAEQIKPKIIEGLEQHIAKSFEEATSTFNNAIEFRLKNQSLIYVEQLQKKAELLMNKITNEAEFIPNISFEIIKHNNTNGLDAEQYVSRLYESKGFYVCKTKSLRLSILSESAQQKILNSPLFFKAGTPDLFVGIGGIDNISSFFMIEVKKNNDSIRYEQIKWYHDNPNIRVLVAWVRPNFSKEEELNLTENDKQIALGEKLIEVSTQ